MGLPAETKACIACGTVQSSLVLQKDGFDIVKCGDCGLMRVVSPLSSAKTAELYTDDPGPGKGRVRNSDLQVARWILRCTGGGRLLEVGCGRGDLLWAARSVLGLEWEGMDRNPEAVARAVSRGLMVKKGLIEEPPYPSEAFDVIVLEQVIEHLRDPVLGLRNVRNLLKPGGWMVAITPGYEHPRARVEGRRWNHYLAPHHLFYYSRCSIALLCEKAGLRVVRAEVRHWHTHLTVLAVRE